MKNKIILLFFVLSSFAGIAQSAPAGSTLQIFCAAPPPTIAQLAAIGQNIAWYSSSISVTPLSSSDNLISGTTYYATQTINGSESVDRLAVMVDINNIQINASATSICVGQNVVLDVSAQGRSTTFDYNKLDFTNKFNANVSTSHASNLASMPTGNVTLNTVPYFISSWSNQYNCWHSNSATGSNPRVLEFNFANQNVSEINLLANTFWGQPGPTSYVAVEFYNNADLIYTKNLIGNIDVRDYGAGSYTNSINNTTTTTVYNTSTTPSRRIDNIKIQIPGSSNINKIVVKDTGAANISRAWVLASTILSSKYKISYLWSTGATTESINPSPATTTNYWVDITINGVTCRKEITITVNPIATPTFTQVAAICSGETLAALPTTSNNGIVGSWSPALNSTSTTSYTFTPVACAPVATMTIAVGTTKTWNAGWMPVGAPTSIDKVLINGNYTASIDGGSINGCTLTVDNNAVVVMDNNANIILQGKLTVTSGSVTINSNSNLVQKLDIANSGNITIKRNSNALFRLDYTQWSSPVIGSGTLTQFSPATVSNRFYFYNHLTNLYVAYTSPSTTSFELGKGYHIRMPNNWVAPPLAAASFTGIFTGVPNNGNYSPTINNSGASLGINIIGNPYPSAIKIQDFVDANTLPIADNITGTLYFWRKTNDPAAPSYSTWAGGTFTQGTATATSPNGIINVGQGFIVEAKAGATNINFNNAMRIANNANHFFRANNNVDYNRIWINATSTSGLFSQLAVGYITNATNDEDLYDAKYFNDGQLAISTLSNNQKYAIQSRVLPFDINDVVPMSFKATTTGDYTIAIDHVDGLFAGYNDIYLRDNANGTVNNLVNGAYSFAANAGEDNSRFELVYRSLLSNETNLLTNNNVFVYKNNGGININTGKIAIDNIKIYDIRGRLLVEKIKVNTTTLTIDSAAFANQILVVKITSKDGVVINKKVVN